MEDKDLSSSMNRYNRQVSSRKVLNTPLTDRGFPVKDLVAERGASLVLPASIKGKEQLSSAEVISSLMSRRKQRLAFDQVSEFDKGRIVAYRDCGLSFREIGSRAGRNQTTVLWM
ncbi:hypothetical protein TNCV_2839411 [Trichonephila clavipes]|nr:hypothetical protein TNCV_2839411 [Trichonephila clavipes]